MGVVHFNPERNKMTESDGISQAIGAIEALRTHAVAGFCSVIQYRKGFGEPVLRVVEPTHALPGFAAIVIRGLQHEPDPGLRLLAPDRLTVVAASERPRTRPIQPFVTEDLALLASLVRRPAGTDDGRVTSYIAAVRQVIADLTIEDGEVEFIEGERERLRVSLSEMRAAHAIVFGEILGAFARDFDIDAAEEEQIERALRCLDELGWAPQT